MAEWVIEEVIIKIPLQSPRGFRVKTSDNGVVSYEDIPGVAHASGCIPGNVLNQRRYKDGDIITSFCNFQTFTKWTIKAQNCPPFAYSESVVNSTECGFSTPVPPPTKPVPFPATPKSPFGSTPYKTYKFFRFMNEFGKMIRVNIKKRNYNGPELEIEKGGGEPVVISYKCKGDDKFEPIRGSEARLNFISDSDFTLAQLYSDDEREYQVDIIDEQAIPEPVTVNVSVDANEAEILPIIKLNGVVVSDTSFSATENDIIDIEVIKPSITVGQVGYIGLSVTGKNMVLSEYSTKLTDTIKVGTTNISIKSYLFTAISAYKRFVKSETFTGGDKTGGSPIAYKKLYVASSLLQSQASFDRFISKDAAQFALEGQAHANEFGVYTETLLPITGLIWRGFIVPDTCKEPFNAAPYTISVSATDSLGGLKEITYPAPVGSSIEIRQRFIDILCYALAGTGLNLPIYTICNLYEEKMKNGADNDPLAQSSVNPLRMADDKGNIFDCYKVLQEVCKLFGAYFVQSGGSWNFVRGNEQSWAKIRRRKYNSEGIFLYSDQAQGIINAGAAKDRIVNVLEGASINIQNAYKRVPVLLKYGETPAFLYNGNFNQWDGQNFNFWTRYGGLDFSRVENTIKNSSNQDIPTGDYRLQFNQRADNNKYLLANDVSVDLGDKLRLAFDFGRNKVVRGYNNNQNAVFLVAKITIDEWSLNNTKFGYIGKFLAASKDGNGFEWSLSNSICRILIAGAYGDANEALKYISSLSFPDSPKTGLLKIQLMGFEEYDYAKIPLLFPEVMQYVTKETNEAIYSVDNIKISATKIDQGVIGTMYLSDNPGYYTTKAEEVEIIYGDTAELFFTAGGLAENILKRKLFAIYTADNSYSKLWYEYGKSLDKLPIGQRLAKTIMQAYQKPFRFWEGSIRGEGLGYISTINIDKLTGRTFAPLSVDFSLKSGIANGTFTEIFYKEAVTIDTSLPYTDGQTLPPVIQDPIGDSDRKRIFTEQFTNQFL